MLETVHWSLGGAAAYRGAVVGPTVHVGGQMIGQCSRTGCRTGRQSRNRAAE